MFLYGVQGGIGNVAHFSSPGIIFGTVKVGDIMGEKGGSSWLFSFRLRLKSLRNVDREQTAPEQDQAPHSCLGLVEEYLSWELKDNNENQN